MKGKEAVSIMTDEKLGKAPDMCLGYFWLLGIVQESIVPVEL